MPGNFLFLLFPPFFLSPLWICRRYSSAYPSRLLRSSPVRAWRRGAATLWGSPRHPWPSPRSEASGWDRCLSGCGTAHQRALQDGRRESERAQSILLAVLRTILPLVRWISKRGHGKLTAVVIDELLQAAELSARCDVEAAAVQLPDLVVLHVQPFGVVVVQHRQTVGTWRDG